MKTIGIPSNWRLGYYQEAKTAGSSKVSNTANITTIFIDTLKATRARWTFHPLTKSPALVNRLLSIYSDLRYQAQFSTTGIKTFNPSITLKI